MRALNLFLNLPWWLNLAVLGALAVLAFGLRFYVSRKFNQLVHDAILEVGASLRDATVVVHSVEPRPAPATRSPYDLDEDDENFQEGLDDAPWDEPGTVFYSIDATITPAAADGSWDPTTLTLVPADFAPDDPTEVCTKLCPLHSAEILANGRFQPAAEREIRSRQRVRLLFAVHEGMREVKMGQFATYFGRIELPAPLPSAGEKQRV